MIARGNTHSRNHVTYSPDKDKRKFWDFGWNEIGQIDLPSMIDYILENTGRSALHYIGHSQGTTSFFVMGSTQTHMNAKIKTMNALAPVAFCSNMQSPLLRAIAPFTDQVEFLAKLMGIYEFLPTDDLLMKAQKEICKEQAPVIEMCANVLFLLGGFNSAQLDLDVLPKILQNYPAGSSADQIAHYGQLINSAKFRKFDYGWIQNLIKYGQMTPPDYDLSKITAPVYLHYSGNDYLSAVKVKLLS